MEPEDENTRWALIYTTNFVLVVTVELIEMNFIKQDINS